MSKYTSDTITADDALLSAWRENSDYDYAREMVQPDYDMSRWFTDLANRMLSRIFGSHFYADNHILIWSAIGIGFMAAAVWFVWRKKPALFARGGKSATAYEVREDTIYGIDFDRETEAAMQRHDYREAVRLTYLHSLKLLTDAGRTDWQPWKTPSQYAAEAGMKAFCTLSDNFVRVRYGNFAASEQLAGEMLLLKESIRKNNAATPKHPKKGGDR